MFVLCYSRYLSFRCLLTGGTVIPVSVIAVVPTFLEKSVFYWYLTPPSLSLGLSTQFVHCCLVTARAFMPASLIVIPYTILEISKFLGQLLVDDNDDDEDKKSQLNLSIASLCSEVIYTYARVKAKGSGYVPRAGLHHLLHALACSLLLHTEWYFTWSCLRMTFFHYGPPDALQP